MFPEKWKENQTINIHNPNSDDSQCGVEFVFEGREIESFTLSYDYTNMWDIHLTLKTRSDCTNATKDKIRQCRLYSSDNQVFSYSDDAHESGFERCALLAMEGLGPNKELLFSAFNKIFLQQVREIFDDEQKKLSSPSNLHDAWKLARFGLPSWDEKKENALLFLKTCTQAFDETMKELSKPLIRDPFEHLNLAEKYLNEDDHWETFHHCKSALALVQNSNDVKLQNQVGEKTRDYLNKILASYKARDYLPYPYDFIPNLLYGENIDYNKLFNVADKSIKSSTTFPQKPIRDTLIMPVNAKSSIWNSSMNNDSQQLGKALKRSTSVPANLDSILENRKHSKK